MKKVRYNFNKKVRLDLLCYADEFIPALCCVYFKDGFAIASDGTVLMKAKISEISNFTELDIEKLNGKYLRRELFKILVKHDKVSINDEGFTIYLPMYEFNIPFSEPWIYPNVDAAFPKDNEKLNQICINSQRLNTLCSSIGSSVANMKFGSDRTSGIKITFGDDFPESVGILMPRNEF